MQKKSKVQLEKSFQVTSYVCSQIPCDEDVSRILIGLKRKRKQMR